MSAFPAYPLPVTGRRTRAAGATYRLPLTPVPAGGGGGYSPTPAAPMLPLTPASRAANYYGSLNRQRADDARKAATFAASAPLPMAKAPPPALGAAPGGETPALAAPAMSPEDADYHSWLNGVGGNAAAATHQAPATPAAEEGADYAGAFGRGPAAYRQAMAARQNFVTGQVNTMAANTPTAPILPLDAQLTQAEIEAKRAWSANQAANAAKTGAQAEAIPEWMKQQGAKVSAGVADTASRIDERTALTPTRVALAGSQAGLNTARANDIPAAAADRSTVAGAKADPNGYKAADAGAHDLVNAAKAKVDGIARQMNTLQAALGKAITPQQQKAIQDQIAALQKSADAAHLEHQTAIRSAGAMRQGAAPALRMSPAALLPVSGPINPWGSPATDAPNAAASVYPLTPPPSTTPPDQGPTQGQLPASHGGPPVRRAVASTAGNYPRLTDPAQAARLAPGSLFYGPDGQLRTR